MSLLPFPAPPSWPRHRLKWCFRSCRNGLWGDEPNGEHDVAVVRVADFDRVALKVRLDSPTFRAVRGSDCEGRLLKKGDLLIEKSGGGDLQPVGVVVTYDHDREAISSNFIARLEVASGFAPRYLTYLNAALYAHAVNQRSIKQTTGIQNLDSQAYLDEIVALPAHRLQEQIADYLDTETAEIDALIAEKERMLALLEEQGAAAITHAIMRGLDPNVPLQASGLEWLGDIPRHWSVCRLKFLATVRTGLTIGKDYGNHPLKEYYYLRVANVQDGYLSLEDLTSCCSRVRGCVVHA